MALCNICIDLQGWRKCRKIAWSNRGPHIPVGYAGTQAQCGECSLRRERFSIYLLPHAVVEAPIFVFRGQRFFNIIRLRNISELVKLTINTHIVPLLFGF